MAECRCQVDVFQFKARYQQELNHRRQVATGWNHLALTGDLCEKMVRHRAGIGDALVSTCRNLAGQLVSKVLKRTSRILGLSKGLSQQGGDARVVDVRSTPPRDSSNPARALLSLGQLVGDNYLGRRVASRRNVTRRLVVVWSSFPIL